MRIFKFWIEHSKELNLNGIKQSSKVFGGSNISELDAIKDAERKLDSVQKIINGELEKNAEYESDIIEEIIEKIDEQNIVTRNRYGALVLNSKNMMFIDIDSYSKSILEMLFKKKIPVKELMLQKIVKTIKQHKYADFGFRVYETSKGYRVLVTNKDFNPRSKESKRMMADFNADHLYRLLCIRQNCYRARLTPKPYRIKQKGIKVVYPNRSNEEEQVLSNWLKEYTQKSTKYATCNLVREFGSVAMNAAIQYHDETAGVKWPNKLA
ncbi:hypothetical protein [Tenacibaculum maritimum]|uniref:hypothetical protein n=1 Tax=Tenacibaculum maritimum TaxID=107401 RepID=UPI0012E6AE9E|nr:hypothetical protein [Tenacibaculum maritimum]CAA0199066.1 conserved hypothetical protein [Tenacibaculum maritimum]